MKAVAFFEKTEKAKIEGVVLFDQCCPDHSTSIQIKLRGLPPNSTNAIHIHEYGDLTGGCMSTGGHFNPFNQPHGNYKIHGNKRHAGDLINNINSNSRGEVVLSFEDELVDLFGKNSVIGRAVVIHSGRDDLGLGGNEQSLTTGNAGGRMACAIIGIAKN